MTSSATRAQRAGVVSCSASRAAGSAPAATSRREREVLVLSGQGRSSTEIAGQLPMSVPMAKTHVSRILTRLGARPGLADRHRLRDRSGSGQLTARPGAEPEASVGAGLLVLVTGLAGQGEGGLVLRARAWLGRPAAASATPMPLRARACSCWSPDLAGQGHGRGVLGVGLARLSRREQHFTEAVERLGLAGPLADLAKQGQGLLLVAGRPPGNGPGGR